jgi:hypothetical protein
MHVIANFLSCNALEEIDILNPDLPILQQHDEFAHAVSQCLQKGELPPTLQELCPPAFLKTAFYGAASADTKHQPAQFWLFQQHLSMIWSTKGTTYLSRAMKVSQNQKSACCNLTSGPT